MHNNVISPLTMLVKVVRDKEGVSFDLPTIKIPLTLADMSKNKSRHSSTHHIESDDYERAAISLEAYLRRMLSRCALKVHIPYSSTPEWPKPKVIKSLLAPTTKKIVRFIDRSDDYWETVVAYMEPISRSLGPDRRLRHLAWDLYLLILAAKYKSEVVLPPKRTLETVRRIKSTGKLNAEAKARLAVIEGLFKCFSTPVEGPCLRFLPNAPSYAVSERIAEIMEDAYLLEASHLRRLFGIKQNIVSVKRDLRRLLSFIRRERHWAKGIVTTSSSFIFGGHASFKALEKLTELVPALENGTHYPVLATSDEGIAFKRESCFQFQKGMSGEVLIAIDTIGWELHNRKVNNNPPRRQLHR